MYHNQLKRLVRGKRQTIKKMLGFQINKIQYYEENRNSKYN